MAVKIIYAVILFLLSYSVTPFLLYVGVWYTGCTDIDTSQKGLSLKNLRNCVFNKLYPPEPFAPYRILDWMPEFPHQNGLSFGFNPTSFCPKVEKLFTEKINEALGEKWRKVTQSTIRAEYDLARDTGYFRVQIVNNKLFGVPAKCCPGSPRHSKCCTERIGPREKYTLAQLWMVLKQFPKQIPDVDFILNTRDEPTIPNRAPIFSYSLYNTGKSDKYGGNIPIPYRSDGFDIRHNQNGYGIATPWSKRNSKLIWRGGPTGFNFNWKHVYLTEDSSEKPNAVTDHNVAPRANLCNFAGQHTDMIDFAFSSPFMTSWPLKPISCRISSPANPGEFTLSYREQQSNFKYILDIEGYSWSSRLKEIIKLDMLVFRVENKYIDFTSQLLVAGKHYVSIDRSLSNLGEKLKWARENDLEAQNIKNTGFLFSSQYMSADAELCYWYFLLNEYSKRQSFQPTLHEMAHEVGKSRVEMTMLEFLFFALAFSCTLLVWLCCINKCLGISIFNASASKNKSIVYQNGDFTRQKHSINFY